jgi:hypothetical protein
MVRLRTGLLASACAALLTLSAASPAAKDVDPIAAEIARWSEFLKTHQSSVEFWEDTKKSVEPVLANAEKALASGKRLRALQYLGSAQGALAGEVYASGLPKDRLENASAFDAEWKRMGTVLGKGLDPPTPAAMDGVRPAAVRAIGEATLPQVRGYYDASLEYGHNTMPFFGYYYIGTAQGQLEFANFCRSISEPSAPPPPLLRSLAAELDALENDLLAAYRPPASIDRHSEFIGASATVNEARSLDAAGLRYGALLRYLQAAARTAPLRAGGPPAADADTVNRRLAEFDSRLSASKVDHSIGRTVLQAAQVDISNAEPGTMPPGAAIIAGDVLPRYFAALEPARPAPPRPAPQVTVTLVRWPYT